MAKEDSGDSPPKTRSPDRMKPAVDGEEPVADDVVGDLDSNTAYMDVGEGEIEAVEIRGYQGERLSSIDDFRENSIKGPQQVDVDSYRLYVTGLVDNEVTLTYRQILENYMSVKKIVALHCVEGWSNTLLYEGLRLADILDEAGVKPDAKTVIFHAHDGYTSSLSLDFVREKDIMLAYKMNEVTLPPERGFPLQVVAEDKWGYKWVKWVTKIELSDDAEYRGFWEVRGYNNKGDVEGPIRA